MNEIHQKKIVLLLLLFLSVQVTCQSFFSGQVKTLEGEILSGATVVVRDSESKKIIVYGVTDSNGRFEVTLNQFTKPIELEIAYLGFQKWIRAFTEPSKNLDVKLKIAEQKLDEVIVESFAIEKKNDTISYKVSQLKKTTDVVIADVIKRLPGIEVRPSGEILYQGKPINKYYIEGLDLLEGRYNLANENLSVDSVSEIEVLENHQPIKILDNIEISDRAALNIKLKNGITASGAGKASLGVGKDPIWETNITPLLFAKNSQFLGSYQSNNIGKNLSEQTRNFYTEDNESELINTTLPVTPPFDKKYWLQNESYLTSANFLFRNKKKADFKISASYVINDQNLDGNTITNYFLEDSIVVVTEDILSNFSLSNLELGLVYEKNIETNYTRNGVNIIYKENEYFSSINRSAITNEVLDKNSIKIDHEFLKIIPIGKHILNFESVNLFKKRNSEYEIRPAQFLRQLPTQDSLRTIQNVGYNTFRSFNSIAHKKDMGIIKLNTKIGFNLIDERFNSNINTIDNNQNFINDIDFRNRTIYIMPGFNFKYKSIEGQINMPVYRRFFRYNLSSENPLIKENFTNFEPAGLIKLKLNNFWNTSLNFSVRNEFGKVVNIYPNFIITNYRNIQRFDGLLPKLFLKDYSIALKYRNTLIGLFGNINFQSGIIENNLLYSTEVNNEGFLEIKAIPEDNVVKNVNVNLNLGKRLKSLKTLFNMGGGYAEITSERILNDRPLNIKNKTINYNFNIETDVSSKISVFLKSNFNLIRSSFQNTEVSKIQQQDFSSSVVYNLNDNSYCTLSNDLYRIKPKINQDFQNNNFLGFEYYYKLAKSKIDLYLKWQNILNNKDYFSSNIEDYYQTTSTFEIRPSQFLVGASLSF